MMKAQEKVVASESYSIVSQAGTSQCEKGLFSDNLSRSINISLFTNQCVFSGKPSTTLVQNMMSQ